MRVTVTQVHAPRYYVVGSRQSVLENNELASRLKLGRCASCCFPEAGLPAHLAPAAARSLADIFWDDFCLVVAFFTSALWLEPPLAVLPNWPAILSKPLSYDAKPLLTLAKSEAKSECPVALPNPRDPFSSPSKSGDCGARPVVCLLGVLCFPNDRLKFFQSPLSPSQRSLAGCVPLAAQAFHMASEA